MQAHTERFGKLDISAQIAGVTQKQSALEDLTEEEFDKVMRINCKGRECPCLPLILSRQLRPRTAFLGVKHSVKAMKMSPSGGKGCSIIICGSQLGLDGILATTLSRIVK